MNDDWMYAYSAKHLFENGSMKLCEWAAPTVVFQVFWGRLFCKLFGNFSFEALRFSTIALSWTGIVFFYLLLKKMHYNKTVSLLGTFVLFFNPLWFLLSYTYMTDVPYLALSIISVYFYYSGIESKKDSMLFAGAFFAGCSYLIRQLGMVIPLMVLLYLFLTKSLTLRKLIIICVLPLIVVFLHRYWLFYIHGLTWAHKTGQDIKIAFDNIFLKLAGSFIYLGIFVMPFSFGIMFSDKADRKTQTNLNIYKKASLYLVTVFLIIFILLYGKFPYFENVINEYGLGTITAHNMSYKAYGIFSKIYIWHALTVLGAVSFIIFLKYLVVELKINSPLFFIFLVYASQFLVSLMRYKFFDRYIMILLPFAVIAGVAFISKRKNYMPVFGVFLLMIMFYTYSGTIDYFKWNNAKWLLANEVVNRGFSHKEIANGFDWDGWFTFSENLERLKLYKKTEEIGEWEWQSLNPYKVIITFKPPQDSEELILKIPYSTPYARKDEYLYARKIN